MFMFVLLDMLVVIVMELFIVMYKFFIFLYLLFLKICREFCFIVNVKYFIGVLI